MKLPGIQETLAFAHFVSQSWQRGNERDEMKRAAIVLLVAFTLTLAACSSQDGTVSVANASATSDDYALSLANIQAQSTLQALQATSQVIEANLTRTAIAPTIQARQSATAQAWLFTSWTATAAIHQTAIAASDTATQQVVQATHTQRVLDNTATVDAAAVSAQITALHGQSVRVELAVERERLMNNAWAITPWVLLILIVSALVVVLLRRSRVRPIFRDLRGDAPLLIVDGKIYDADRNPQPLVDLSGEKPAIPALTDLSLQAATTARDQMIDLASRSAVSSQPNHRQEIAQKMIGQTIPAAVPEISVLSPDASRPLLHDVLPTIVRDTVDVDILEEDQKGGTA